jgi:Tfp pilus assembly protein PilO
MNLKNRQDFLVMLTIAAIGLFVAVNFILTPLQHWWSDRQAQVRQLRDQVKEGNQLVRREAVIRSRWDDMRANALPPRASDAEQEFLKAMDDWSRDSGARITSILPQWKGESTNYMTLDCRVESDGDLGALSKFIYDIEKGPTAVRVDSVELGSHDNEGQQMTMGLQINGLVLLQNDKK